MVALAIPHDVHGVERGRENRFLYSISEGGNSKILKCFM
jgi:hypothetical protein